MSFSGGKLQSKKKNYLVEKIILCVYLLKYTEYIFGGYMKKFDGFMHGVNLGGWFSQCDYSEDRLNNFIKEEDLKVISGWKMDHIRLPIDYNIVENKDGSVKEDGYARIDKVIEWCKKYNLNMILDLHKTAGFSFDKGHNESGFFEK